MIPHEELISMLCELLSDAEGMSEDEKDEVFCQLMDAAGISGKEGIENDTAISDLGRTDHLG